MRQPLVPPARTLIVDDEASARRQLRSFLQDCPQAVLVGEARDGEEAVRALGECRPEIVLLDIRMPRMDGLEAAKLMRRKDPDVFVVFLTAYPEFEYAREAVRLEACDYVLKPVRRDELLRALRRALERRGQRTLQQVRRHEAEGVVRSLLPFVRREYLSLLVTCPRAFREDELTAQGRVLGLRALPRLVAVALVGDDRPRATPEFAAALQLGQDPARPDAGAGWAAASLHWPGGDALLWRERSRVTAILAPWPAEPADPRAWAAQGAAWISRGLGAGAAVAAGDYCREFNDLPTSYRTALERYGVAGQGSAAGRDLLDLESGICDMALKGDPGKVASLADEILGSLPEEQALTEAHVLAGLLAAAFVRGGLAAGVVAGLRRQFEALLREQAAVATGSTSARVIASLVEELNRRFSESSSVGKRAVETARAFVEANYSRPLTLREVAAHVYLSPYYFARLFKTLAGMTLGDYITEARLARACDLLLQTEQTVAKVADKVGYGSGSYFTALFTKRFGVSPSQYRRKPASSG